MWWAKNFDVERGYQFSPRALSPRASSPPAPIVVTASQDFDGNDGPWSSFAIQVGTPAQTVKVLISTASYQTWVVLPQGCTSKDPSNCESSRGEIFHPDQSRTWIKNNFTANGTFSFPLESNFGYRRNAEYGYDTLALGWKGSGGSPLQHQVVAGIATKDFYMGLFGVNPRPSNFTNFDETVPSFMSNLKNQSMIPSLAYAYTSGNQYRANKVFASLTLGGYDSSRFISNNISFPFDQKDERDLTVTVESVTLTAGRTKTSLMSTSIQAFIDSTIPYLYLPLSVCRRFEKAFGLTFNDTVQAYLVNDTLHQQLLDQNANIAFTLGKLNTTETLDISLPYAAFDLIADYPLMPTKSRYFPLMRATNDSQYTLGRTFLQEAYLIVDYERFNFSVSQCDWSSASQRRNIIPINAVQSDVPVPTSIPRKPHHVSAGAIAGAILGGIVGLSFLLVLWYKCPRIRAQFAVKDRSEKPQLDGLPLETKPEMADDCLDPESDSRPNFGVELQGMENSKQEAPDSQHWIPELPSSGRHSMVAEANGTQDWVPELPTNRHTQSELPA